MLTEGTYESDVNATRGERASLCGPTKTIFKDPSIEKVFVVLSKAKVGGCYALEYVVVVLRDAENAWGGVGNIPKYSGEGWG